MDDFDEWLHHPTTIRFLKYLKIRRFLALEDWGRRKYVGPTTEITLYENALALGGVKVLDALIELQLEDIQSAEQELIDGKQVRHTPEGLHGTDSP